MHKQTFNLNHTVGEIVAAFPQSSDFFKKYKIDFCCGGKRTLDLAIAERNLQEDQILNELELYYQNHSRKSNEKDWREVQSNQLINHIISEHHNYANSEVKQLTPYIKKVSLVHGEKHPYLKEVLVLFNELKAELNEHFEEEETFAFPQIINYEENKNEQSLRELIPIVTNLIEEHDQAGEILKQIRQVTSDYQLPERLVYQRLEMLEGDMFQHIHLENNILFPRYMD